MKKDINQMTCSDAEYVFTCHIDGGYFNYPYFHGYHENGVGSITQEFKCHLREANKEKLLELFDVNYDNIPNPKIISGYIFENVYYQKKHSYKIKKIIKDKFNLSKKELKGSLQKLCDNFNLSIEYKYSFKY